MWTTGNREFVARKWHNSLIFRYQGDRVILSKASFSKIVCGTLAFLAFSAPASFAQGAQSADQTAFSDDADLLQLENSQIRQLQNEEMNAETQAQMDDQRNQAYRLYAQKKLSDLEKLKGGDAARNIQVQVMQSWLRADLLMRQRDQATINSLRQRIAQLEQSQQTQMGSLGSDVQALREDAIDARSNEKFKQQMAMNYFNELQTEMGPASWYEHPTNGVSYSMGGMGFNGGQQLLGGY